MWVRGESGKWEPSEPYWLNQLQHNRVLGKEETPLFSPFGICLTITHSVCPQQATNFCSSLSIHSDLIMTSEPFISCNTFCTNVALSGALWLSGLCGSTISMRANQGQCWHKTGALETEFLGGRPTLPLTVWHWTTDFLLISNKTSSYYLCSTDDKMMLMEVND